MTQRDRLELLLAYHAGSLDESVARSVQALLQSGDPATVGASAEALETLARLAATTQPVAPGAHVRQKLLAGLAQRREQAGSVQVDPRDRHQERVVAPRSNPQPGRIWSTLRVAALAAVVSGVGVYLVARSRQSVLETRVASVDSTLRQRDQRLIELERMLAAAEAGSTQARTALAAMYSADARFGVLNPAAGDTNMRQGRVIVDPTRRQLQVYVFDLVAPPAGRTYQLWLLPEGGGGPIPSITFDVDPSGRATVVAPLPDNVPGVAGAAVSEEATGGSTTGAPDAVKLIGKAG